MKVTISGRFWQEVTKIRRRHPSGTPLTVRTSLSQVRPTRSEESENQKRLCRPSGQGFLDDSYGRHKGRSKA